VPAEDDVVEEPGVSTSDPLGTTTLVLGCLGIVVAGVLFCVVTGFLAAIAGGRAREAGRSLETAYLGFALAAVDGAAWIVLHMMFDIPFLLG
jgi:hypothetical protein